MHVLIKRKLEGPSIPELGQPTSTTFNSVTVPVARPSTGPAALASYELQRSLDGTTWSTIATGPSIFGNPAAQYVDGGRTALTTYYYRARATDVAGRVSDFCAPVSLTTSAQAGVFSPNYPRVAAGYVPVAEWKNPANWTKLSRFITVIVDNYYTDDTSEPYLRTVIAAARDRHPRGFGTQPQWLVYSAMNELVSPAANYQQASFNKVNSENWWLRVTGSTGAIVPSAFAGLLEVNNTQWACDNLRDANGKNYIQWRTEFDLGSLFFGGTYEGYTTPPNPLLGGMFYDNIMPEKRVNGDYDRDGDTDVNSDLTYSLSLRQGYATQRAYFKNIAPSLFFCGNSELSAIVGGAIYEQNFVPNFDLLGPAHKVLDGGFGAEFLLTDPGYGIGDRVGISKEWQQRNNGLVGFWSIRNEMRYTDGLCTNPALLQYLCHDIEHNGSAADNQRLRFAAACVTVCSDGCINDRGWRLDSGNNAIYTNNAAGHGWLGQARQTPRYAPDGAGVYVREFDNGFVAVNPRNNGTRTFTVPVATRNVSSGELYSPNAAITIRDRDGVFLVRA